LSCAFALALTSFGSMAVVEGVFVFLSIHRHFNAEELRIVESFVFFARMLKDAHRERCSWIVCITWHRWSTKALQLTLFHPLILS